MAETQHGLFTPQTTRLSSPLTASGARILCRALAMSEVRDLFGIPGTHNMEFYDALAEEPGFNPILITDEQSAGFMADGFYRSSGRMAALNLVPGAGLTHALSGIAEAFLDQIPMLVIMSAPRNDLSFAYQLHEIDQGAIAGSVVKELFKIRHHQELFALTRYACRLAQTAPMGPVAIIVPAELLFQVGSYDPHHLYPLLPEPALGFSEKDYQDILAVLLSSERPGLYLGLGATMPAELLEELAERLDALVFTSISGKGVFPEGNPRLVWNGMGRALPPALQWTEQSRDCFLAIACRFSEVATASYGFEFHVPLLHVDIDPKVLQRNYAAEKTLQADARCFVERLLRDLPRPVPGSRSAQLSELQEDQERVATELRGSSTGGGVNPQHLFENLQLRFGPESIYAVDSGNGLFKAMEALRLPRQRSFLAPVDFSCMGYAVPAAIGARFANPHRPVIAIVGDGAMLMTGLEMLTAKHYGLGILFIILDDGKLAQIAQFQRKAIGSEKLVRLQRIDYRAFAAALGLRYLAVDELESLDGAIIDAERLCSSGESVLLSLRTDYAVPSFFTRAVLRTNAHRLRWNERLRMASRLIRRKINH